MNEKKLSLKNEKNQTKTNQNPLPKNPDNLPHFPTAFLKDFCGITNMVYAISRVPLK